MSQLVRCKLSQFLKLIKNAKYIGEVDANIFRIVEKFTVFDDRVIVVDGTDTEVKIECGKC